MTASPSASIDAPSAQSLHFETAQAQPRDERALRVGEDPREESLLARIEGTRVLRPCERESCRNPLVAVHDAHQPVLHVLLPEPVLVELGALELLVGHPVVGAVDVAGADAARPGLDERIAPREAAPGDIRTSNRDRMSHAARRGTGLR